MANQQEQQTTTPPTSSPSGDQQIEGIDNQPVEKEPVPLESVLGDPEPEPEPVTPDPTEPPAPAVEQPGPDGEQPDDEEPQIERLADGRVKLGKYVADDELGLAKQIERARRNAEKLIGKKEAELQEARNPFEEQESVDDEDFSEDVVYSEQELAATFGKEIAQGLIEAGVVPAPSQQPQGPDPVVQQQMYVQALEYADRVIAHPEATGDHFRAALQQLVQVAPHDAATRQRVLDAWGVLEPAAAAQEAAEIRFAELMVQQEIERQQKAALEQQQQQAQQQQVEQASAVELEQQQAFADARGAFMDRNPDWTAHNDAMNEWMAANRPLMAAAKGNRAAVYAVLQSAYDYAVAKSQIQAPAGVPPVASEHGGVMGDVTAPTHTDPTAGAREAIAQQRELAGLETGAAIDDVTVHVTNPNPAGLAETPIEELIGIKTVR